MQEMRTTWFTTGLFRMFLALAAYINVLAVSSTHCCVGAMVAMMQVFVYPPRESFKSRVSLLSRCGM